MLGTNHGTGRTKAARTMNHIARSKARMQRSVELMRNTGHRIDRSAAALLRSGRKNKKPR